MGFNDWEVIGAIDDIERYPIESSGLASAGYSVAKKTLAIQFRNGNVFHYSPVEQDLATEFLEALSKGQFYSAYIRNKIPSKLMTGPCQNCGALGAIGTLCTDCGTANHMERERRTLTEQEKAIEAREGHAH